MERLPTATVNGLTAESLRLLVCALVAYTPVDETEGHLVGMLADRLAQVRVRNYPGTSQ